MKTIDFGTSKTEIVRIAREIGAKYVIEWHDHYRGNSKGYYRTIDELEKSNHFNWNEMPDDRGAINIILTDKDVPTMIEERGKIIYQLERLRWERMHEIDHKAYKRYGGKKWIDGRWSIKNPKYIEAEEHNAKIRNYCIRQYRRIDKSIKELKEQLKHYNLVSSTMWHCTL
jgi:hypothetical protein